MGGFYAMHRSAPYFEPAMSATPTPNPNAPLSDDEIDELADLVDLIDEHTDADLAEGMDGFITALVCSPRAIPPEDISGAARPRRRRAVFEDAADAARFWRCSIVAATRSPGALAARSKTG
jgi:hypothetical protein